MVTNLVCIFEKTRVSAVKVYAGKTLIDLGSPYPGQMHQHKTLRIIATAKEYVLILFIRSKYFQRHTK